jgi:hypothetical protein
MEKNNAQINKFSATASIRLSLDEGMALLKRADTLGKGIRMAVESFINGAKEPEIDWDRKYVSFDQFISQNRLSKGAAFVLWELVNRSFTMLNPDKVRERLQELAQDTEEDEISFD